MKKRKFTLEVEFGTEDLPTVGDLAYVLSELAEKLTYSKERKGTITGDIGEVIGSWSIK